MLFIIIGVTSLVTCRVGVGDAVGLVIIIDVVVVIGVEGKTGEHTSSLDAGFSLAKKQVGYVGTLVGVVHLLRKQAAVGFVNRIPIT